MKVVVVGANHSHTAQATTNNGAPLRTSRTWWDQGVGSVMGNSSYG